MVNPFKRISTFLDKCPCASECELYTPNGECGHQGFSRCGKAYELTKKKMKKKMNFIFFCIVADFSCLVSTVVGLLGKFFLCFFGNKSKKVRLLLHALNQQTDFVGEKTDYSFAESNIAILK